MNFEATQQVEEHVCIKFNLGYFIFHLIGHQIEAHQATIHVLSSRTSSLVGLILVIMY